MNALMKKKLTTLLTTILLTSISITNAVNVWTLKGKLWSNPDISNKATQIEWSRSIIDIISFVNGYLWFAIGLAAFIFMIRNGYQLIISQWDEKAMKDATKAIIWCVVALVVCLLAYIIVNIAIKLFA